MKNERPGPSFNQQALSSVEGIIQNMEDNRLREAFESLLALKHDLLVRVRREKALETESLK